MDIIGIIAEYNPFHYGHIYHIEKIKELFPDSLLVLVMSSSFTERGIPSIMNKWDKTEIALSNQIDLVVELPFVFATQSADIFAREAIHLLKELGVQKIVFGSESKNIEKLNLLADTQIHNKEYDSYVQMYMDEGMNYPTAMNKALKKITGFEVVESNDLLGLSYIKEIKKQNAKIEAILIQRTNDFLDQNLKEKISSATAIREAVKNKQSIHNQVPEEVEKILMKDTYFMEDYFPFLKYKILSSTDLSKYLDVDEGIERRILKQITNSNNYQELVENIKTKRYTYNKLNRMFTHILCGFTKEDKSKFLTSSYIRILGFNENGRTYLNQIKKNTSIPILTKFKKDDDILNFEKKVTSIYILTKEAETQQKLIEKEYKNCIIRK